MFAKTVAAAALVAAASNAVELNDLRYAAPSNNYYGGSPSYGYSDDYSDDYYEPEYAGKTSYGYERSVSYGFPWKMRSHYRPKYYTAETVEPVDNYWKSWERPDEQIRATCEFDFIGYSYTRGYIRLTQNKNDNTEMIGDFDGLAPGLHALKIHEYGDLEYGCESVGDVFNPYGSPQGNNHEDIFERRVGDIEQLQTNFNSHAEYRCRDGIVDLAGPVSVVGRSIVIYEREDDHHKGEHAATEGSEERVRVGMGKRIGCCVIGLERGEGPPKPEPKPEPKPVAKVISREYSVPSYGKDYLSYGPESYGPGPVSYGKW